MNYAASKSVICQTSKIAKVYINVITVWVFTEKEMGDNNCY
jgi:hypothetical protein